MKLRFPIHPRAWIDSMLSYPRFFGTIKPELMRGSDADLGVLLDARMRAVWPRKLECPLGGRLLAISPHPDDEVIGCGGLLALHSGKAEIRIVNVYNGDGGGELPEGPWRNDAGYRARLVEARSRELDAAAADLQASDVLRFGVSDCDGTPGAGEVRKLRELLLSWRPDVVLLPWFLDKHPHHRLTNRLLADAADGLSFMVLGYEVWGLLPPNAVVDISGVLDRKLSMVRHYMSQLRTVDYAGYVSGLARARAFHHPVNELRTGAVEAYLALPVADYCELVRRIPPPGET
jgi:LmbE family N-acetylglucosaminyl deacetylase